MAGDAPQSNIENQDGLPVGPIPGVKYPVEVIYCGGKYILLKCLFITNVYYLKLVYIFNM